jgi:host factor-I protein
MAEFETGMPSIRQIQHLIKEGQQVESKLMTGDLLMGQLLWQDSNCICLITQEGERMIIWRHAIAYIKPQEVTQSSRSLQVIE